MARDVRSPLLALRAWMESGLGWRAGLDGEGFPCKPEAQARGIRDAHPPNPQQS